MAAASGFARCGRIRRPRDGTRREVVMAREAGRTSRRQSRRPDSNRGPLHYERVPGSGLEPIRPKNANLACRRKPRLTAFSGPVRRWCDLTVPISWAGFDHFFFNDTATTEIYTLG